MLLPAFSDPDQRLVPPSTNFPRQLPDSGGVAKFCQCGEQFSNYGLYALHQCLHLQERRMPGPVDLQRRGCRQPAKVDGSYDRRPGGDAADVVKMDPDSLPLIKTEKMPSSPDGTNELCRMLNGTEKSCVGRIADAGTLLRGIAWKRGVPAPPKNPDPVDRKDPAAATPGPLGGSPKYGSQQLRAFSCSQCHKQFRSNSHLARHVLIHSGERRYPCSVCDKRFSEPSSVKRHMYIHTNEAPHACPTCGHRYSSPCYLREHMLSHSGERPNKCPVCEKQYSRAGHLTRHLRQHARCRDQLVGSRGPVDSAAMEDRKLLAESARVK